MGVGVFAATEGVFMNIEDIASMILASRPFVLSLSVVFLLEALAICILGIISSVKGRVG